MYNVWEVEQKIVKKMKYCKYFQNICESFQVVVIYNQNQNIHQWDELAMVMMRAWSRVRSWHWHLILTMILWWHNPVSAAWENTVSWLVLGGNMVTTLSTNVGQICRNILTFKPTTRIPALPCNQYLVCNLDGLIVLRLADSGEFCAEIKWYANHMLM